MHEISGQIWLANQNRESCFAMYCFKGFVLLFTPNVLLDVPDRYVMTLFCKVMVNVRASGTKGTGYLVVVAASP